MDVPKKSSGWKWLFWLLIVPLILFALYVWFVLSWSYSSGERAGYLQKLSKRGWLCKTWEGELALVTMPGTVAEKFLFTVRSDELAQRLNAAVGQRVTLDYEQHIGLPTSCFGDTQYFISDVRVVPDIGSPGTDVPAPPAAGAAPPVPTPAPTPVEPPAPQTPPGPSVPAPAK